MKLRPEYILKSIFYIIQCPNCLQEFFYPDLAPIKNNYVLVCKDCRHKWHQDLSYRYNTGLIYSVTKFLLLFSIAILVCVCISVKIVSNSSQNSHASLMHSSIDMKPSHKNNYDHVTWKISQPWPEEFVVDYELPKLKPQSEHKEEQVQTNATDEKKEYRQTVIDAEEFETNELRLNGAWQKGAKLSRDEFNKDIETIENDLENNQLTKKIYTIKLDISNPTKKEFKKNIMIKVLNSSTDLRQDSRQNLNASNVLNSENKILFKVKTLLSNIPKILFAITRVPTFSNSTSYIFLKIPSFARVEDVFKDTLTQYLQDEKLNKKLKVEIYIGSIPQILSVQIVELALDFVSVFKSQ